MQTWLFWFLPALCLLAAVIAAVSAFGTWRWHGGAAVLTGKLEATRVDDGDRLLANAAHARVDFRELQGLPAPVQRYFRAALTEWS